MGKQPGEERGCWGERGQSSVIGVVLILGIVIASLAVIATVGGLALLDTEDELSVARAEKVMTQFDSQSALVALGETDARQTRLASGNSGGYTLDEDAGWMRVSVRNTTDNTTQVVQNVSSLGSLTYETDGVRLAYQAGGVWQKGDGDAVMISPPEFHYRGQTLTLPVINVTGDGQVSRQVSVRQGEVSQGYPDRAGNSEFVNPVPENREVTVTVKSEYYRGWGSYFERRTEGNVSYDKDSQTASITLTVPIEENFDESIIATGSVSIQGNPDNGSGGPIRFTEATNRPSASARIDNRIQECKSGNCTELSSTISNDLDDGVYYIDSTATFDGATALNTSNGDIDIVVDGGLEYSGNGELKIDGDGNVTFYLKNRIKLSGNGGINSNGNASSLLVYIHSDANKIIQGTGTSLYRGLVYAPKTDLKLAGTVDVYGSFVVRDANIKGNSIVGDVGDIDTIAEFAGEVRITYLHISENAVEITDS
jgi:hypothetical protein